MSVKVCIVTCYKDPDYVRARTLRKALLDNDSVDLIVVKNRNKGLLRYPEVVLRLMYIRLTKRPDVYLLTFRGYELLPIFWLITLGKKRIFDEFINLVEWVVYEHKKVMEGSIAAKLIRRMYRFFLKRNKIILTDTKIHAEYSAKLMNLPLAQYMAVPVSTDEQVFKPQQTGPAVEDFQVFYYGNMLPLHGLQYVIEAAVSLQTEKRIKFLFIGGDEATRKLIIEAQAKGAQIEYKKWVPFDELPRIAAESQLCLGGPFGNTLQARMVVTGKTYQFLAMGLPTLVGVVDEETDFVDKKNCLIVPQADSSAVADKIKWALSNRDNLAAIGTAGHQLYTQKFSNQVVARCMREVVNATI